MESSDEPPSKRKRSALYFDDDDTHDIFFRMRIVAFHARIEFGHYYDDALLDDRYSILKIFISELKRQASQSPDANWWHNRGVILTNLHLVHFLVYDLAHPGDDCPLPPIRKVIAQGGMDPIWEYLPLPQCIIRGKAGSEGLLLGWTLVEDWTKENVMNICMFDTFVRGHNFGEFFYQELRNKFPNLIVAQTIPDALRYWIRIGAAQTTREVWAPRDLERIGWGIPATMTCNQFMDWTDIGQLLLELEEDISRQRNRLLLYLCLVFDCDFPILEAMTVAWPEPLRLTWLYRVGGGIEFTHEWELSEEIDMIGKRSRKKTARAGNTTKQLRFDPMHHWDLESFALRLHEIHKLSFRPSEAEWLSHLDAWKNIFARCGLLLQGSLFGDILNE
jgi:hypothetical protein